MRRILWLAAGLLLLAAGLYLAGREPSVYFLEREIERYHEEERRPRYTLLAFHAARAEKGELPDLRLQMEQFLRETKILALRGWEVVLVPSGARPPGQDYRIRARHDASAPADPPQLKGPVEAWVRPRGWLARLFARR